MKKSVINLVCASLVFLAISAAAVTILKETGAGLYIGTRSNEKVGFWGITPITQPNVATGGVSSAQLATNIYNALLSAGVISSTN